MESDIVEDITEYTAVNIHPSERDNALKRTDEDFKEKVSEYVSQLTCVDVIEGQVVPFAGGLKAKTNVKRNIEHLAFPQASLETNSDYLKGIEACSKRKEANQCKLSEARSQERETEQLRTLQEKPVKTFHWPPIGFKDKLTLEQPALNSFGDAVSQMKEENIENKLTVLKKFMVNTSMSSQHFDQDETKKETQILTATSNKNENLTMETDSPDNADVRISNKPSEILPMSPTHLGETATQDFNNNLTSILKKNENRTKKSVHFHENIASVKFYVISDEEDSDNDTLILSDPEDEDLGDQEVPFNTYNDYDSNIYLPSASSMKFIAQFTFPPLLKTSYYQPYDNIDDDKQILAIMQDNDGRGFTHQGEVYAEGIASSCEENMETGEIFIKSENFLADNLHVHKVSAQVDQQCEGNYPLHEEVRFQKTCDVETVSESERLFANGDLDVDKGSTSAIPDDQIISKKMTTISTNPDLGFHEESTTENQDECQYKSFQETVQLYNKAKVAEDFFEKHIAAKDVGTRAPSPNSFLLCPEESANYFKICDLLEVVTSTVDLEMVYRAESTAKSSDQPLASKQVVIPSPNPDLSSLEERATDFRDIHLTSQEVTSPLNPEILYHKESPAENSDKLLISKEVVTSSPSHDLPSLVESATDFLNTHPASREVIFPSSDPDIVFHKENDVESSDKPLFSKEIVMPSPSHDLPSLEEKATDFRVTHLNSREVTFPLKPEIVFHKESTAMNSNKPLASQEILTPSANSDLPYHERSSTAFQDAHVTSREAVTSSMNSEVFPKKGITDSPAFNAAVLTLPTNRIIHFNETKTYNRNDLLAANENIRLSVSQDMDWREETIKDTGNFDESSAFKVAVVTSSSNPLTTAGKELSISLNQHVVLQEERATENQNDQIISKCERALSLYTDRVSGGRCATQQPKYCSLSPKEGTIAANNAKKDFPQNFSFHVKQQNYELNSIDRFRYHNPRQDNKISAEEPNILWENSLGEKDFQMATTGNKITLFNKGRRTKKKTLTTENIHNEEENSLVVENVIQITEGISSNSETLANVKRHSGSFIAKINSQRTKKYAFLNALNLKPKNSIPCELNYNTIETNTTKENVVQKVTSAQGFLRGTMASMKTMLDNQVSEFNMQQRLRTLKRKLPRYDKVEKWLKTSPQIDGDEAFVVDESCTGDQLLGMSYPNRITNNSVLNSGIFDENTNRQSAENRMSHQNLPTDDLSSEKVPSKSKENVHCCIEDLGPAMTDIVEQSESPPKNNLELIQVSSERNDCPDSCISNLGLADPDINRSSVKDITTELPTPVEDQSKQRQLSSESKKSSSSCMEKVHTNSLTTPPQRNCGSNLLRRCPNLIDNLMLREDFEVPPLSSLENVTLRQPFVTKEKTNVPKITIIDIESTELKILPAAVSSETTKGPGTFQPSKDLFQETPLEKYPDSFMSSPDRVNEFDDDLESETESQDYEECIKPYSTSNVKSINEAVSLKKNFNESVTHDIHSKTSNFHAMQVVPDLYDQKSNVKSQPLRDSPRAVPSSDDDFVMDTSNMSLHHPEHRFNTFEQGEIVKSESCNVPSISKEQDTRYQHMPATTKVGRPKLRVGLSKSARVKSLHPYWSKIK